MTKKHFIAIATVVRDSNLTLDEKITLANDLADAIEPISKNFDRDMFMAYSTSASIT